MTANLALLLVSGGLVAALFLIVLLLVDGWGMSPAAAGLVVTVMPLAAIAVLPLSTAFDRRRAGDRERGDPSCRAASRRSPSCLVRGGHGRFRRGSSSARGSASPLAGLAEVALRGRADQIVHGGSTIAFRHAGVVLGLLLLAPVLTTALEESREEAIRAGAAVVLDSAIPPLDKLGLAQDVLDEVERAKDLGELPDVERAFEGRPDDDALAVHFSPALSGISWTAR